MKTCAKCKESKPLESFYRQAKSADGRGSYCRECAAAYMLGWNAKHPEYAAAQMRTYVGDRAKRAANVRHSRQRHPDHERARGAVRRAVAAGRMPPAKALSCVDCGEGARQYDHARGYSEAHHLDVEPVCTRCHGIRSRSRGEHRRKVSLPLLDGVRHAAMPEVARG